MFDTGVGPNLVSRSIVPPSLQNRIQQLNVLLLQTANKQPPDLEGVELLHIHVRDLEVRVWFGVVNELPVDVLVRTFVMNRYERCIFPLL